MARYKLRKNSRPKAIFGADGMLMAGATLTAAAMNVAATIKSSKDQAKSMVDSANIQAKSIEQQNEINTQNVKEQIATEKQLRHESDQIQVDQNMSLQMLAGQENMNDRMESAKQEYKYGGRVKRRKLKSDTFYRGGRRPFIVTDGGEAVPIQTDNNGYGLYELFGNDHEHYHKTRGGKYKSGVGIRFNNGEEIEGEGNQNSNQGELLYVTPNDVNFISKHSIKGFNPAKAVDNGMHPEEAFAYQEAIKDIYSINDDGTKAKYGGRRKLKKCGGRTKAVSGLTLNTKANVNLPTTINTSLPSSYGQSVLNDIDSQQTSSKFGDFLNSDFGGAAISAGANLIGSAANIIGGAIANRNLNKGRNEAAEIIANSYRNLSTIDENIIDREDYNAPKSLAVVRYADTNINPQLTRINRDAAYEKREINRNTLSSAARQQRFAATNDRQQQRVNELSAWKHNQNEQIKQNNASTINAVGIANADREVQANRDYTNARLSLKQYNNNIKNSAILGEAQAYADARSANAQGTGQFWANAGNTLGSALMASGAGFTSAYDTMIQNRNNYNNLMIGQDVENQVLAAIKRNDKYSLYALLDMFEGSDNAKWLGYSKAIKRKLGIS